MQNRNVTILRGEFRGIASVLTIAVALFLPGIASAVTVGTVTVDGVREAGEYTRAPTSPLNSEKAGDNSGSESLKWFNDHHSIYTLNAANMNPMYWEVNENNNQWVLNLFVEVPDYARRMVWLGGCDYKDGAGPYDSDCDGIPLEILDAYFEGARDEHEEIDKNGNIVIKTHKDSVKMDYGTQTGSEYFQLNSSEQQLPPDNKGKIGYDSTAILCFGLQDDGGHCDDDKYKVPDATDSNGDGVFDENDGIYWQTSRHWVLDNVAGCDTVNCLALTTTMSIEIMKTGFGSKQLALDFKNSVSSLQLHLSDEARGIPAVPVPAAFWLFGTALIGFIGISRRTNLS